MTDVPDIINGCFEALGCVAILLNFRSVLKDKQVAGVSILAVTFFASWGIWNLFYYYQLDQMWSWYAGIGIFLANLLWIGGLVYYTKYPGGQRFL